MVATDRACSLVAHYAPVFPCLGGASVSATRAASERREREREREKFPREINRLLDANAL